MNRITTSAILLIVLCSLQSKAQEAFWHQGNMPAAAFLQDVEVIHQYIAENHGGTNRYTSPEELEQIYNQLQRQTEDLSLGEAYYKLAQYVDILHDGHTWIMPSKAQSEYLLHTQRFLPFTITVSGTEMFVDQNFSNCHGIHTGTRLITIDGMPIRTIVRELLPYFTADGNSLNGKLGGLEGQFWWYYGLHFGFDESHKVEYAADNGSVETGHVVSIYMNDMIKDANEIYCRYNQGEESAVSFEIEGETGILNVRNFTELSLRGYKRAFEEALFAFKEAECQRMIIDVRENGGGKEGVENLLLSCMHHTLDEKYDAVEIRNPIAPDYQFIDKRFFRKCEDKVYRLVEFRKDESGSWIRRNRFERTFIEPENRFQGEVYILIDRNVFSGASEFAALASDYATNCTLVGEETCGGYQGHTSGYYYDLVLPNSGFLVHIPRIWFDLKVQQANTGGVKPDIQIVNNPHVMDVDAAMQFVLSSPVKLAQAE